MPLVVPVALLIVIGVPAIIWISPLSWRDAVRGGVLAMTGVTSGLYFATVFNICFHLLHYDWPDRVVHQMALGRLCRVVSCLTFMLVGATDTVQRLGHREFAVYTPLLAFTDVLLLIAWLTLDVRRWAAP